MKYKNYVFDLYGTLVDIHTDEEAPAGGMLIFVIQCTTDLYRI